MLLIMTVLLCMAYCTAKGEKIELWGSRVVGIPKGQWKTMQFRFEKRWTVYITVDEVTLQKRLDVFEGQEFDTPLSTTLFLPYCNLSPPAEGIEVNIFSCLNTSFKVSNNR
ncbi:hypothetical protein EGR_07101 [Echinococcus granulosus]|uniref:Uncharacterized protein n=1 Tax=Echinococcus granulosus TaxID=6210 RepID=W6UAA7_ECHGR|nr:hypothetical protein EGR_07101 [Echinococcus granulosus]EUB57995.1 hypothetical protein EGR_07101 [Echinococcus granulosus]